MSLSGNSTKTQKKIPPAGAHVGRIISIVDIGTHIKTFPGKEPTPEPLMFFTFELVNLPYEVFMEGKPAQPFVISQEYAVKLGDRAKLQKMLCNLIGVHEINDLQLTLKGIIGKAFQVNVVHTTGAIVYANIGDRGRSVSPLMQGITVNPNTSNPIIMFDLDTFSWDSFMKVPEWLQKKIEASAEWHGIITKYGKKPEKQVVALVQPFQQPMQQNNQFAQESVGTIFVALNGAKAGPFTMQQLASMKQTGQFTTQSQIWYQGLPAWISAAQDAQTSGMFIPIPPSPPVPQFQQVPPAPQINQGYEGMPNMEDIKNSDTFGPLPF